MLDRGPRHFAVRAIMGGPLRGARTAAAAAPRMSSGLPVRPAAGLGYGLRQGAPYVKRPARCCGRPPTFDRLPCNA